MCVLFAARCSSWRQVGLRAQSARAQLRHMRQLPRSAAAEAVARADPCAYASYICIVCMHYILLNVIQEELNIGQC